MYEQFNNDTHNRGKEMFVSKLLHINAYVMPSMLNKVLASCEDLKTDFLLIEQRLSNAKVSG